MRVPDETVRGRMDHIVAATISAIEAQSPDYCSQVACLLALNGVQQRTVLTHLPLEWPFVCLNLRFSHNDVANLSPLQRIAIAEALRCWLPSGERHIPNERVPPDLLLQPLLHWVFGVAHFLASVCSKGREAVQLEPPDLLAGLCSPEQWEGYLLEVILADWAKFGDQVLDAQAARVQEGRRAHSSRVADLGEDFRTHASLTGLCRASFATTPQIRSVNFLL